MKRVIAGIALSTLAVSVFFAKPVKGAEALTEKKQSIAAIAALTAKGDLDNLYNSIEDGLNAGLSVNEIGEVLLQAYAYTGFPRSLNAQATLARVLADRKEKGIAENHGVTPAPLPARTNKYDFGREKINELINGNATQSRPTDTGYAATTDVFLKEHLFADITGRETLSFQNREIATVAMLSALYTVNPQLSAHMDGAMNTGNTEDELKAVTKIIGAVIGKKEGRNAEKVLATVLETRKNTAPAAAPAAAKTPDISSINTSSLSVFPIGNEFPSQNFSGKVWLTMLNTDGVGVANVTFEPGCRNNWHVHHKGGQILLATGGAGWVQLQGQRAVKLLPGSVFYIPPETNHWHGAADDSWFTHIAIEVPADGGSVSWGAPVTDAEYSTLKK